MTNVAAIQMVSTDNVSENLQQAEKLIEEAVTKRAKLITLPENFPLMGKHDEDRLQITESFDDGPLQLFLSEQSKKYKIWLLGGTIPLKSNTPEKVFATSLLFNPNGEMTAQGAGMAFGLGGMLIWLGLSSRDEYNKNLSFAVVIASAVVFITPFITGVKYEHGTPVKKVNPDLDSRFIKKFADIIS